MALLGQSIQPLVSPQAPVPKPVTFSTSKKPAKKTNLPVLIVVLVVLVGGFGAYMINRYFPEITQGFEIKEQATKVQIKDVDWENSVFQHSAFKTLTSPQPVLIETPNNGGNPNPFVRKLKK